jgi:hypothetical protein
MPQAALPLYRTSRQTNHATAAVLATDKGNGIGISTTAPGQNQAKPSKANEGRLVVAASITTATDSGIMS